MNQEAQSPTATLPESRRIGHEMRNAIGAVRTATELLARRHDAEKDQRLLRVMLTELDRLGGIVNETFGPPKE